MLVNDEQAAKVNVIVADDHPVVVMGISSLLNKIEDVFLAATATTINQLFEALSKQHCDILICDYSFEDDDEPDGLLLLEKIRRLYPEVKIILFSVHDDLVIVQQAIKTGISGFLSKASNDAGHISLVIKRILSGEKYLDPLTSNSMLQHLMANHVTATSLLMPKLTARELEVVRMFSRGMSVTDIALYTARSVKTISTQKKQAMLKLGASNDVELINAFKNLY